MKQNYTQIHSPDRYEQVTSRAQPPFVNFSPVSIAPDTISDVQGMTFDRLLTCFQWVEFLSSLYFFRVFFTPGNTRISETVSVFLVLRFQVHRFSIFLKAFGGWLKKVKHAQRRAGPMFWNSANHRGVAPWKHSHVTSATSVNGERNWFYWSARYKF